MSAKKILIIEDEMVFAMELKKSLQLLGYTIVGVARRGAEGVRLARETWPDLILMDIHLQGSMDGIEAAEKINSLYSIPIIFLTAYSDDATVSRVIRTEQYGFLTKPFNDRELYSNIEMAISQHRTRKKSHVDATVIDSMISLVSDPIITTGISGHVTRMNAAAEELTGYTQEEMTGNVLWKMMDIRSGAITDLMQDIQSNRDTVLPIIHWPDRIVISTKHRGEVATAINVGFIRDPSSTTIRELLFVFSRPDSSEPDAMTEKKDMA